jgi:hypothetical protein
MNINYFQNFQKQVIEKLEVKANKESIFNIKIDTFYFI